MPGFADGPDDRPPDDRPSTCTPVYPDSHENSPIGGTVRMSDKERGGAGGGGGGAGGGGKGGGGVERAMCTLERE